MGNNTFKSPCGYKGIQILSDGIFLDLIQTQPGYIPYGFDTKIPSRFVPLTSQNERDIDDVQVLTKINTFSIGMIHSQGLVFLNTIDTLGYSFDTTFQLPFGIKSISFFSYFTTLNY